MKTVKLDNKQTSTCLQQAVYLRCYFVVASVGVYARGKFCGDLKVCRPAELLCFPARRPSRRDVSQKRAKAQ